MNKVDEIINAYEISSEKIYNEAMHGMHDNRIISKEERKMSKLFYEFSKDESIKMKCIEHLWNSRNAYSRVYAPIYCLAMNIYVDEAIMRLEELQNDMSVAPFSSHAYIALDLWKTNGKITIDI